MHLLSFAKGALAMFWLLALANLFVPLGPAWFWPLNLAAAAVLLAHIGEVLLLRRRLQAQPRPWLERMQVLLFGVLHIQGLPRAR